VQVTGGSTTTGFVPNRRQRHAPELTPAVTAGHVVALAVFD
jgi:hypothetical protein